MAADSIQSGFGSATHDSPSTATGGHVGRVQLAHEPSFRVGPLKIEPALRHIAHADGREETVEPRVMQVLVALLRAAGGIVSRDDLIACCWDGRIVGDDAINRVISRLRRISEGLGMSVFKIETITKVGYRISVASDITASDDPSAGRLWGTTPAARPTAPAGFPAMLAVAVALAFVLTIVLALTLYVLSLAQR